MRSSPVTAKGLRRRHALIIFLYSTVSALLVLWFLAGWRIKTVELRGNARVSSETLLQSADVRLGTHLYGIRKDRLEAAVRSADPYIKSVSVKRRPTSKLLISVEEYTPVAYTLYEDEALLLSSSLAVLERLPSEAEASALVPCRVLLPEVKSGTLGNALVLADEKTKSPTEASLASFFSASFADKLRSIDLSDRFSLSAELQGGIRLSLGSGNALDQKLEQAAAALAYIEKNMLHAVGTVYVTEKAEASFVEGME